MHISLMSKTVATLARKNSLKGQEDETVRGNRLKREPREPTQLRDSRYVPYVVKVSFELNFY